MLWLSFAWMLLKRLRRNWRLAASLLAGLTIAVAIVSSISIYTDGALQRLLARDLAASNDGRGAGEVLLRHDEKPQLRPTSLEQYDRADRFLAAALPGATSLPLLQRTRAGGIDVQPVVPEDGSHRDVRSAMYADIRFQTGIEQLVDVIDGRLPAPAPLADGTVEAMVDEAAQDHLDLLVGSSYRFPLVLVKDHVATARVQVVGIFRPKSGVTQSRWPYLPPFDQSFFVGEPAFRRLLEQGARIDSWSWYWVFDAQAFRLDGVGRTDGVLRGVEAQAAQLLPDTALSVSPVDTLERFIWRGYYLRLLLLVLAIPIAAIVCYYIVLASGLAVQQQKSEIAVLKSRGASTAQVVAAYAAEGLMLGLVALLIGPGLGLLCAKVMGASAGFLTFVDRAALPVIISRTTIAYSAIAALGGTLAGLLPVLGAARHSIVTYRQEQARALRAPVWQRYFFDVVLLIAALYGHRALAHGQRLMAAVTEPGSPLQFDPYLFFIPAVFIVAISLLALRLFPLLMAGLAWLAGRYAGVPVVMTLRQIARNPHLYSPLVLLVMLTVALGTYSAAAARTLSRNFDDRVRYATGADVILRERWETVAADDAAPSPSGSVAGTLVEPPPSRHENLPGVRAVGKVYTTDARAAVGGRAAGSARLMAVDPQGFVQVAWWRSDLAPYRFTDLLQALLDTPDGILLSRDALSQGRLRLGDSVQLNVNGMAIDFRIVGAFDYWPTLYPADKQGLAVVNLDYLIDQVGLVPYDWWLRLEPGAPTSPIVQALQERGSIVVDLQDARHNLAEARSDPQRTGLFGELSIAFIAAVLITVLGFFLYTLLSLRNRYLQFGVLRALGLSIGQLISMLALEQVASVGLGLLGGTALGLYASRLFLPFLQLSTDIKERVPGFLVVTDPSDLLKIYAVLGAMLVLGVTALAWLMRDLRLHQAVKLGEEQ